MNYVQHLENLCKLVRELERGCNCEHAFKLHYRCNNCETVVRIKHAIDVFDRRKEPLIDTCTIPGCISHAIYMRNAWINRNES